MIDQNNTYREVTYDTRCSHQFFELRKVSKYSKELQDSPEAIYSNVSPDIQCCQLLYLHANKHGVRIKCAICGEQKDLWEEKLLDNQKEVIKKYEKQTTEK